MNFGLNGNVCHNGQEINLYGEQLQINSSLVKSAAYYPTINILQITFPSGEVYAYFNVPPKTYLDLATSESKGKYFHKSIINKFPYKKVEEKRR